MTRAKSRKVLRAPWVDATRPANLLPANPIGVEGAKLSLGACNGFVNFSASQTGNRNRLTNRKGEQRINDTLLTLP